MADQAPDVQSLLNDVKAAFSKTEELDLFKAAESKMKEANRRRERENQESQNHIESLEIAYSRLQEELKKSRKDWKTPVQHLNEMNRLENDQFSLGKKCNEQEAKLNGLENELKEMRKRIRDVEMEEVASDEMDDHAGDTIALSLFRKLGWTPSLTPGSNPNHSQMPFDAILARSDQRSGLLSINVTEQYMKEMGLSEFAVADQLWKAVE